MPTWPRRWGRRGRAPAAVDRPDHEAVLRRWRHREDVPDRGPLELGNDPVRARNAAVVEPVVAVPARAPAPHLDEPRPDLARPNADRDRVSPAKPRARHQRVARKRSPRLIVERTNRAARHDAHRHDPCEPDRIANASHTRSIAARSAMREKRSSESAYASLAPRTTTTRLAWGRSCFRFAQPKRASADRATTRGVVVRCE
jgi:hypothetical protein